MKKVPAYALVTTILLLLGGCLGVFWYLDHHTTLSTSGLMIVAGLLGISGFLLYLYRTGHYLALLEDTAQRIHVAPIQVKGGMAEELGPQTAALLLADQFARMKESFIKISQNQQTPTPFYSQKRRVPGETSDFSEGSYRHIEFAVRHCPLEFPLSQNITIQEDLVINIGPVALPVGALFNLITRLLKFVPLPARDNYLGQLVHLSLTAQGNDLHILVYRQTPATPWWKIPLPSTEEPASSLSPILTWTVPDTHLSDLRPALRDAVFMILGCDGRMIHGEKWLSVRCFIDGLELLEECRKTWEPQELVKAKHKFAEAAEADPTHYQAWYYYGTLLLAERTRASIQQAHKVFEHAVSSADPRLRALAHAGLANCFAQQIHRLAIHRDDVLGNAEHQTQEAITEWTASGATSPHPWILATSALVRHVSESGSLADRRRRYTEAAGIYYRAIAIDSRNAMLYNNLGWVFLKLAQWGIQAIPMRTFDGTEDIDDTALEALRLLQHSLELYPNNKLSQANLCLLYALPQFREQNGHLAECRFHGLAAVKIDPLYIGGHRDLAISLIRYGELDEAFHHFQWALRLCGDIDKGLEMTREAVTTLEEMNIHDEQLTRWQHAASTLVVPRI